MTPPFLFLDCQTTGMHPNNGHLLELAWGVVGEAVESYLVALPEGEQIPKAVRELTGITRADMEKAVTKGQVLEKLRAFLAARPQLTHALIHYAQFEKPWLEDLFGGPFPLPFLCTHKIARRLFPNSPSRSIRGILGYLGRNARNIQRAAEHVEATKEVWFSLEPKLGGRTPAEIEAWLGEKPAKAKEPRRIQYRLEKEKRLTLPAAPGIYRMLSQSGQVLYVGKATSLKARVNSYFRGQKGRDRKKLEMLAHVWDIETVACGSPLEAALLETDEIKRLDPPYNIMLKKRERSLAFYSRDFSQIYLSQEMPGLLGPFRGGGAVEQVKMLLDGQMLYGLFDRLEVQLVGQALAELREKYGALATVRECLALGIQLLRERKRVEALETEVEAEPEGDEVLAVEEESEEAFDQEELAEEEIEVTLRERLESLLRQAAREYRQSRAVTKLLNAKILLRAGEEWRALHFVNGKVAEGTPSVLPWAGLGIEDFDRMSVLRSELTKVEYRLGGI